MSDIDSIIALKRCSTCGTEKPLDRFCKKAKMKDGLNGQCKDCTAKSRALYYQKNHDAMLERASKYYREHPPDKAVEAAKNKEYRKRNAEAISSRRKANYAANTDLQTQNRERARKWYYKNKARQLEIAKKYYAEKSEHIKERVRKYELANTEKVKTWGRIKANKRRARLLSTEDQYTADDITEIFKLQKGKCANCRKSISGKYHIDHKIPVAKGGSNHRHNIELLCPSCNLKKSAKWPHEFAQENGRLI